MYIYIYIYVYIYIYINGVHFPGPRLRKLQISQIGPAAKTVAVLATISISCFMCLRRPHQALGGSILAPFWGVVWLLKHKVGNQVKTLRESRLVLPRSVVRACQKLANRSIHPLKT